MKKSSIKITPSSGNVFADLNLENPEELLAKAELAYKINSLIKEKELTQVEAAEMLGIDQPKISALARGRLSGFSLERLFKYLTFLDQDIEIIIRPHNKSRQVKGRHLHLQVKFIERA